VSSDGGSHIESDPKGKMEASMAQTDNPFLDGVAKAFTDAAGMAQTVRTEIDTFVRQRLERLVADMDFVPREEFEAVKAMAAKARAENESLAARVAALESKSGT
jgi:BMFP domain-containing protein YqiC